MEYSERCGDKYDGKTSGQYGTYIVVNITNN